MRRTVAADGRSEGSLAAVRGNRAETGGVADRLVVDAGLADGDGDGGMGAGLAGW